jgi:hypothetical protein
MQVWSYQIKFICFALWVSVFVVWLISVVYMIVRVLHDSTLSLRRIKNFPMLMSTVRVVRACMVVGVTDLFNASKFVMAFEVVTIMIGNVMQIVILGENVSQYSWSSANELFQRK